MKLASIGIVCRLNKTFEMKVFGAVFLNPNVFTDFPKKNLWWGQKKT